MFRALWTSVITFVYILVVGTPFLVHALLTENTDPLYRIGVLGAKLALRLAGVTLSVRGRERIPASRAAVYMPNHQSNCDGPALFSLLPPVLILAKKEFFGVPILGPAMRLRGFVAVDRKHHERAIEAVEQAARSLKQGHSFLVFPEGTRSRNGRLQPFKRGVFVMAIKGGVPIVPISISGGTKIMRKGELAIHPGTLHLTFHNPIPTEGRTLDDRFAIMESVRQSIMAGLAEDELPHEQQPDGSAVDRRA